MSISIHAPLTGSDPPHRKIAIYFDISIHAPLTGSDLLSNIVHREELEFQSTLPLRGATLWCRSGAPERSISIHAPLTGSDTIWEAMALTGWISIHAPLTGSDCLVTRGYCYGTYFNPRSPYGERPALSEYRRVMLYFNPRSPYGERPQRHRTRPQDGCISIHAPLTGSDSAISSID